MPLTARSSKVRYRSIPLHNLHCGFHPPVPGSIDSLLFHYWHIERSHPPHPPSGFRWKAENIGNRPDSTGTSARQPPIPWKIHKTPGDPWKHESPQLWYPRHMCCKYLPPPESDHPAAHCDNSPSAGAPANNWSCPIHSHYYR